ncbi:MAG: flippase-like domain-containing protein [Anaerolineae bacterium]|nr:flippase-like domain-containing protein [Anaerolineae bacterium]
MKSLFRRSKSLAIGLVMVISLAGGYYLARNLRWEALIQLGAPLIAALLALSLGYLGVYAISVWGLLYGLGYNVHFGLLWLAVTSSMSSNYLTPVKAGIPVRLWLYKALLNVPVTAGGASVVVESALGMLLGVGLAIVGAPRLLPDRNVQDIAVILGFGVLGALIVLLSPQLSETLVRWVVPKRYIAKILHWESQFCNSLRSVPVKILVWVIILYSVRLAIRALCIYLVLYASGGFTNWLDLLFAQAISGMVGIISMLPTGLGARDASMTLLLMNLGIPQDIALVGVLVDRVLWTLTPFGIGLLSINILSFKGLVHKETLGL